MRTTRRSLTPLRREQLLEHSEDMFLMGNGAARGRAGLLSAAPAKQRLACATDALTLTPAQATSLSLSPPLCRSTSGAACLGAPRARVL
jgi:hypothetical protein